MQIKEIEVKAKIILKVFFQKMNNMFLMPHYLKQGKF